MRKGWVLLTAVLLLTGCGAEEDAGQDILQRYESMESCRMEAVVSCEFSQEQREYTMQCDYNAGGECRVDILEPVGLQGISVVFDGDERQVLYEDIVLDAGTFGESRLSPVEILPRCMDAVKNGWLLEENSEEIDEEPLRLMTFETEENGVKQYWSLLFDEKTGLPLRAEVSEEEQLFFRIEFTAFSVGAIMSEEETVETTESNDQES